MTEFTQTNIAVCGYGIKPRCRKETFFNIKMGNSSNAAVPTDEELKRDAIKRLNVLNYREVRKAWLSLTPATEVKHDGIFTCQTLDIMNDRRIMLGLSEAVEV